MTNDQGFWQGRSVLVTGGCGFIGSHLVEALLVRGATVRVVDLYTMNSSVGHLSDIRNKHLDVRLGDVADGYFMRTVADGVDTIFHLAALIGIPYSYIAPAHYVRTNIDGTVSVLEAARAACPRRVIHTSTSETYGSAQYQPIDERHPAVAQSPYAATKTAADQLAISYFRSFGVPVAICRPFNTYGPRQSLRAVLPTVVAQALYSDVINVGSLYPLRDMNYVSDTVDGFIRLGEGDQVEGEAFNISAGKSMSIGEMIAVVQGLLNVDKEVRTAVDRVRPEASELDVLIGDYSKALAAVGYAPAVSFEEGVLRVRDYLLDNPPPDIDSYYV